MAESSTKGSEETSEEKLTLSLSQEQVETLVGLVRKKWGEIPASPTGDRSPEGYAEQEELTSLVDVLEKSLKQASPKEQ